MTEEKNENPVPNHAAPQPPPAARHDVEFMVRRLGKMRVIYIIDHDRGDLYCSECSTVHFGGRDRFCKRWR